MIRTLLVANRGEIARRIFDSCRPAGIGTVAVCSEPDAEAPHAREADLVVALPGASAAQTYLNGPAIVAAALAAGADAVHPGYGFLSEDAGFATAVLAAGLTWVGPPPVVIAAMGLKITARKLAAEAGLPVLPELDPAAITDRDFPVLVKASAGGGGRGMRVARAAAELPDALAAARREAAAAFGDGTVFCEPLLTAARHIEVQVLADSHGTIWALTERDCSVQRRYQKVIEESPAPAVGPRLREQLLAAATAVTRAVGYLGAGTAEFLVTDDDQFFFLEFNTRLQVEHPVTECVHGIDLVALQLQVAQGAALPAQPPPASGHAIEARLYAEDPADGYRPASGTMHDFAVPGVDARFTVPADRSRPVLRLDAGVEPGTEISPYYDPMLAKLIAWAPGRDAAARRLATALAGARIHGPATNADLLAGVLRGPAFLAGQADTSLLDGYDTAALVPGERDCRLAALAAALAGAARSQQATPAGRLAVGGWRNVPSQPQRKTYHSPAGQVTAAYWWTRDGITVADSGEDQAPVTVVAITPGQVTLELAGVRYRFDVASHCGGVWVDSALGRVALRPAERLPAPAPAAQVGSLLAPMPGIVVRVAAEQGTTVTAGQPVLMLEAMKMEHVIAAPSAGLIAELRVAPGDQVSAGDVLAILTCDEDEPEEA